MMESTIRSCVVTEVSGGERTATFRIDGSGEMLPLSRSFPILVNLGVEVVSSTNKLSERGWTNQLVIKTTSDELLTSSTTRHNFTQTFLAIARRQIENDGFNKLVCCASLNAKECVLLRLIAKYLVQVKFAFSPEYMVAVLCRYPRIAAGLVELFHLRFDPSKSAGADAIESVRHSLRAAIDVIESIDDDRIVNAYLEVIEATVRTNFFKPGFWNGERHGIAIKLMPGSIRCMPKPVPMFETFVYSPDFEGVHLRGGRVARGGIRWSERMEDYRTEILGLVKTQMVKNAVIVPTGAKGGFICKTLLTDESGPERSERIRNSYLGFIRALLDITDNLVEGEVVKPTHVVCRDDDDPYLVVAADKGTATFSDIANALAAETGYWLGDAFASGGAKGYDHKKMGITARGAWESARRLFQELGKDPDRDDFSVVGIGDLSGDVFGNGMLLSRHIRLIAAFDHRHIFIDPDPDVAASFEERRRIFALTESSWEDYDRSQLSTGGRIYKRSAKQITLSPEAAGALGFDSDTLSMTPAELIRAILLAPVDLLWNGGIGTYVRAQSESDLDVGDKANDPVRVTASQLRARAIVEGGNLGLTQRARVEYALGGGLINTDAIDNSAGVDCSDHEVNIKILLDLVQKEGLLDRAQRDRLLAEMTDDIAGLVLRNNALQSKMLSQSNYTAPQFISQHGQLIELLEQEGRLNRRTECLPSSEEIGRRSAQKQGLTRPEIAVLLAYSKSRLFELIAQSDLVDDPWLRAELFAYFPRCLGDRYRKQIAEHPLRREILAAQLTNTVINRMGSTFCLLLLEEKRLDCADWIRAYTAAREILGISDLAHAIDAREGVLGHSQQMELRLAIHRPLQRATNWLLRQMASRTGVAELIAQYRGTVAVVRDHLQRATADGVSPDDPGVRVAELERLYHALDIAEIVRATGAECGTVTELYFGYLEQFDLPALKRGLAKIPEFDKWYLQAKELLVGEIDDTYRRFVEKVVCLRRLTGAPGLVERQMVEQVGFLVGDLNRHSSKHLPMYWIFCRRFHEVALAELEAEAA